KISKPRDASGLRDETGVKLENFVQGNEAHLGQAPVELAVLLQNPCCYAIEVLVGARDEIPESGGSEIIRRNVKALCSLGELLLDRTCNLYRELHGFIVARRQLWLAGISNSSRPGPNAR